MKSISFRDKDNDIDSDLINIKRCNNSKDLSLLQKNDYDKIIEDEYEEIKLSTDEFFLKEKDVDEFFLKEKNTINEEKNIIEEKSINETLNKISINNTRNIDNENEFDEFQDFENIELKEQDRGDFTEITISSLSGKKSENKNKDPNNLLFNLYQELNFSTNTNKDKLSKTCIG